MAGKSIQTTIVINGMVGNSFFKLGNALTMLGAQISQISSGIIDFGKESAKIFGGYEQNMLDAKGALTAQYTSANNLNEVMKTMGQHASKWASTTRFHTDDVSAAISTAAHAGWDMDKMLKGIPEGIKLAQAGNIDLADGLDYLIKAMNMTGTSFNDAGKFVDQWAMAANSTATNIDELGQALMRMGGTARFADSTEELFTMLGVLANYGQVGEQAGTLVRNSMLRVIAPTKKASTVMEQLGVTAEELEEFANSDALQKSNELLEQAGFSAYKSNGDLKSFLQIYKELYKATSGMNEQDKNTVIASIFPTRTITGAMALLQAASNEYDGLEEKIRNSEGYAQTVADIQESGLEGSQRRMESRVEELKRSVGEWLAPKLMGANEIIGGMADTVAGMSPGMMDMLGGTLGTIGAAGPGLLATGGAMRLIGALMTPFLGKAMLAVGAAALLVGAVNMVIGENERAKKSKFGQLEIDIKKAMPEISAASKEFRKGASIVQSYEDRVKRAATAYEDASKTFSEQIITHVLSQKELTEADKTSLRNLASEMQSEMYNAINASRKKNQSYITALLGVDDAKEINLVTGGYFNDLLAQTSKMGAELGKAMDEAFSDGIITGDEQNIIFEKMQEINKATAKLQDFQDRVNATSRLQKAQTISLDSLEAFFNEIDAQTEADLKTMDQQHFDALGIVIESYEEKIKNGEATESDKQAAVDMANAAYKNRRQNLIENQSQQKQVGFDSGMSQSDYGQGWNLLTRNKGWFDANGGLTDAGRDELSRIALNGTDAERAALNSAVALIQNGANYSKYINDDERNANPQLDRWWKQLHGQHGLLSELSYYANVADSMQIAQTWTYPEGMLTPEQLQGELDAQLQTNPIQAPATVDMKPNGAEAAEKFKKDFGTPTVNAFLGIVGGGGTTKNGSAGGGVGGKFANGGRATKASIFGEAGAEWAIPEEHSNRTANLLDAARKASGFSWPELIARNGGLNGDANQQPTQIIYQPTIYANDASGVAAKLSEDKERFARWFRERQTLERVGGYA